MERYIDANKIVYSWQFDADGNQHDGVTLESIVDKVPTADVAPKAEIARDIFVRLYEHRKYDGVTTSVWESDLILIAKEYGIDLEKIFAPKKYTEV